MNNWRSPQESHLCSYFLNISARLSAQGPMYFLFVLSTSGDFFFLFFCTNQGFHLLCMLIICFAPTSWRSLRLKKLFVSTKGSSNTFTPDCCAFFLFYKEHNDCLTLSRSSVICCARPRTLRDNTYTTYSPTISSCHPLCKRSSSSLASQLMTNLSFFL